MIAEITKAEEKESSLPNRPNYLAMTVICEGNTNWIYLSPKAFSLFTLFCAFADAKIDGDILDTDSLVGKLVPVEPRDVEYLGRMFHTLEINFHGMRVCLCSYLSPVETNDDDDFSYIPQEDDDENY